MSRSTAITELKFPLAKILCKLWVKCFVTGSTEITQLVTHKIETIFIAKLDFSPNSTDYQRFLDLISFHWKVNSNCLSAYRMLCPEAVQTVASVELLEAEQEFTEGIIVLHFLEQETWVPVPGKSPPVLCDY